MTVEAFGFFDLAYGMRMDDYVLKARRLSID